MHVQEILISLALVAGEVTLQPPSDGELLRQAEASFHEGEKGRATPQAASYFSAAAREYESLDGRGIRNPALYRNQAHAFLLAGDFPRAILICRRALLLFPHDGELQDTLAFARDQVRYPANGTFGRPPSDLWPPWLPWPAPAMRLLLAWFGYGLLCVAMTRWWMTRRAWLLVSAGVALAILALPTSTWVIDRRNLSQAAEYPIVVLTEDGVLLRKGDGLAYPAWHELALNRGVEAHLLHSSQNWVKIDLGDGETGWVQARLVLIETP